MRAFEADLRKALTAFNPGGVFNEPVVTGMPQQERALPWHASFVLVSAYLIAIVRPTGNAEELAEYRRCVGATMEPYVGRYLARSEPVTVLEGDWDGAQVVVVEFPSAAAARAWNDSKAYQEIAPLRLRNTLSVRVIVEGPGRS